MIKLTTWQIITLVTVMFAAIILSQKFAPTTGPTIVGMCTTLFAVFVEKVKSS